MHTYINVNQSKQDNSPSCSSQALISARYAQSSQRWLPSLALCASLGLGAGFAPSAQAHCVWTHPGHCVTETVEQAQNVAETINTALIQPSVSTVLTAGQAVKKFTNAQLNAAKNALEAEWNNAQQTVQNIAQTVKNAAESFGNSFADSVKGDLETLVNTLNTAGDTADNMASFVTGMSEFDGDKIGSALVNLIKTMGAQSFGSAIDILKGQNAGSLLLIVNKNMSAHLFNSSTQTGVAIDRKFLQWALANFDALDNIGYIKQNYKGHILSLFNVAGASLQPPDGLSIEYGFIIGYHVAPPSGVGGPGLDVGVAAANIDIGTGFDVTKFPIELVAAVASLSSDTDLSASAGASYTSVMGTLCDDFKFHKGSAMCNRAEATNGGPWGSWTAPLYCPENMFATGYGVRMEGNKGGGDDTAANAVRLQCTDGNGSTQTITPHNGHWGSWYDTTCNTNQYLKGYQIRVESHQGNGDDTAMNGLYMECSDNQQIMPAEGDGHWGSWGNWDYCPAGQAINGLKVKVEAQQGGGDSEDDTALNDVVFYCSDLPNAKIFLKSHHNTYLRIKPDGDVDSAPHKLEWETLTMITHLDGKVSFKSYHDSYLAVGAGNTVSAVSDHNQMAKFTLVYNGDGTVSFRDQNNHYLNIHSNSDVYLAPHLDIWEKFMLAMALPEEQLSLQSHHDTYLRIYPDGNIDGSPHSLEWETLTLITNPDQTVSLQSYHGTFLKVNANNTVSAITNPSQREKFTMTTDANGKVSFQAENDQYLGIDNNRHVYVTGHLDIWEKFQRVNSL